MQSALAKRPIKNRLFSLSVDLQRMIYGYVDWEYEVWSYPGRYRVSEDTVLQHILRDPLCYYWAVRYEITLRGVPTLKNAPYYFCAFCESPMRREKHNISKINCEYAWRHASTCNAMCTHFDLIRSYAGHYYCDELTPYKPYYKANYDRIYKEHFEDLDNKFDKDAYEKLCLAYPEKRIG